MIVASFWSIVGRGMPVHVTGLRVQRADAASQLVRRLLEGLRCCLVQVNRIVQLKPLDAISIQNHSHSAHRNSVVMCLLFKRHCRIEACRGMCTGRIVCGPRENGLPVQDGCSVICV